MKNQKLDQLFEKKLKHITREPTPEAWEKTLERLGRNNKKKAFPRLYIAASFAAIVALGIYLFSDVTRLDTGQQQTDELAQDDSEPAVIPENNFPELSPAPNIKPESGFFSQTPPTIDGPAQSTSDKNIDHPDAPVQSGQPEERRPVAFQEIPEPDRQSDPENPALSSSGQELTENRENAAHVPVTITYKRSAPDTAATQIAKKENRLEKFLLLAQEIRDNHLGFSTIRQAKDELLDIDINFSREDNNSKNSN